MNNKLTIISDYIVFGIYFRTASFVYGYWIYQRKKKRKNVYGNS
jgi:hypothetical protein